MSKKLLIFFFSYLISLNCNAQSNTGSPIPVCTETGFKGSPVTISDGDGGAIIFWKDAREIPPVEGYSIYAQRITKEGVVKWKKEGVKISTGIETTDHPTVVSDGKGGAIIAWEMNTANSYDVYVQHINADGVLQWNFEGQPICKAAGAQQKIDLASDGNGGTIIIWNDSRVADQAIYAQYLNADGSVKWIEDGILISKVKNADPKVVFDGRDGAIVVWNDNSKEEFRYGIYAQRIDHEGKKLWTENGTYVADGKAFDPIIISDGGNGAIIAWEHFAEKPVLYGSNISMQHVDSDGVVKWGAKPVPVFDLERVGKTRKRMVSDDNGGVIITWNDVRNDGYYPDIYAQRINAEGTVQWLKNGIVIAAEQNESEDTPRITKDGLGGAIITWEWTSRYATSTFAQSVNATGKLQWNDGYGIFVNNGYGPDIVSDEVGGALIAWGNILTTSNINIYARAINQKGHLSVIDHNGETDSLISIFPNPVVDFLALNSVDQIKQITIFNENGQSVLDLKGDVRKVDLSSFCTGIYIVNVFTDKMRISKKMIKK